MADARSKFVSGDQAYLLDEQYQDGSRLTQRANLHSRYGTAELPWFDWVGVRLDLFEGAEVLEVGCGTGWLWSESTFSIPSGVALMLTDLSPGMTAEAAHAVSQSARLHSVTAQVADLQALPFDDASYDRVIANHMVYHLSEPLVGVAELARVVRPDGALVAATNGPKHLRELSELSARVFGTSPMDETAAVFGPEVGSELLHGRFHDVRWHEYPDLLRCTDPADVLAHICSKPPGETATPEQLEFLTNEVEAAFEAGGGQLLVTKEAGVFVCRGRYTPFDPSPKEAA